MLSVPAEAKKKIIQSNARCKIIKCPKKKTTIIVLFFLSPFPFSQKYNSRIQRTVEENE